MGSDPKLYNGNVLASTTTHFHDRCEHISTLNPLPTETGVDSELVSESEFNSS
jgi:hypothetical protein